jgi:hypothetical protein
VVVVVVVVDVTAVENLAILQEIVKQRRNDATIAESLAISSLSVLNQNSNRKIHVTNAVNLVIMLATARMKKMKKALLMSNASNVELKVTWPKIAVNLLKHVTTVESLVTRNVIASKISKISLAKPVISAMKMVILPVTVQKQRSRQSP